MARWLERRAYLSGLLPMSGAPSSWSSMADMSLAVIVTARVEIVLKHAAREFPELGER